MIKEYQDAYGAELRTFLETGAKIEIVERDDGYIDYNEGIPYYFAPYEEWADYEKEAIEYAFGRIVDVGCGAGRVALYLQNKGFFVIGIDNSPGAIRICQERGIKKLRNIPFTKIDKSLGPIDSFILFGNNFGLFGSYKRARWLLRRLKSISSKNAVIIAQATDPYKTKDPNHLAYHELNRKRGRMPGQLRIRIRHKKYIGSWFDYLFVSKKELEQIIEGTGWEILKYIDNQNATYIAVLKKKIIRNPAANSNYFKNL